MTDEEMISWLRVSPHVRDHKIADALEAKDKRIAELDEENRRLMHSFMRVDLLRGEQAARIAALAAALREAYEVYAGSDGFIPETAAEGYQQQIIKQMVDIIGAAMEGK